MRVTISCRYCVAFEVMLLFLVKIDTYLVFLKILIIKTLILCWGKRIVDLQALSSSIKIVICSTGIKITFLRLQNTFMLEVCSESINRRKGSILQF